jgi:hypothetical protein
MSRVAERGSWEEDVAKGGHREDIGKKKDAVALPDHGIGGPY